MKHVCYFYSINSIIRKFLKLEETKIELEKYRDESENLQIIISDYEMAVKQLTNGIHFKNNDFIF